MKVVFLESIEGTAQVGEVKEVKNGFARNFLLPRGLAAPAIEPYLRRAEVRAAHEAKRQEALDGDASAIAERIDGARITISALVGEQDKLFGSVTSVRIAEEVAKLTGEDEFDHRKVLMPEAIKEVGIQSIRIRLTRNVEATIEVEVIAEGEDPEMAGDETEVTEAEAEEAAEASAAEESEEPQAEAEEAAEASAAEESEEPPAEAEEAAEASAAEESEEPQAEAEQEEPPAEAEEADEAEAAETEELEERA